jgi:hypothetical protein
MCRMGNLSVQLPAHIYVDCCQTVHDAMKQCATPRDTLHELFTICQNLTKQLQMQHRRSICLRDINVRNIVRANVGTMRVWTLLEYCNATRVGTRREDVPAASTPPEVRCPVALLPFSCSSLVTTASAPRSHRHPASWRPYQIAARVWATCSSSTSF